LVTLSVPQFLHRVACQKLHKLRKFLKIMHKIRMFCFSGTRCRIEYLSQANGDLSFGTESCFGTVSCVEHNTRSKLLGVNNNKRVCVFFPLITSPYRDARARNYYVTVQNYASDDKHAKHYVGGIGESALCHFEYRHVKVSHYASTAQAGTQTARAD